MANEEIKHKEIEIQEEEISNSICRNPDEQVRLLKLFQIFIKVDKRLKKQSDEKQYSRNTNNTSKAK